MQKIFNSLLLLLFLGFCSLILALVLKGNLGNPTVEELNTSYWKESGPLELSPERGRFILTYSLIENRSFKFPADLANVAIPDLGIINGNYVSLFNPEVSFLAAPGYILGKALGASQVGTFAVISLFALFNIILIRSISINLGISKIAATIGSLVFIFTTPAFAYATTLYQHHITTFIILLSIYSLIKLKGIKQTLLIWYLYGLAIILDFPNLFLMMPIAIYSLSKIFSIKTINNKTLVNFNFLRLLSIGIIIIPLAFLFWFNNESYGNPFKMAGTTQRVFAIDNLGKPSIPTEIDFKNTLAFIDKEFKNTPLINYFKTRNMINGLYTLLISPDRGMMVYTPIMILGFWGLFLNLSKGKKFASLTLGVILFNLILYSMWGDPWGGWAFGSRYLIPSYAILSIYVSYFLSYHKNKWFMVSVFLLLVTYSVFINTAGAVSSNTNPPVIEVLSLEEKLGTVQKYDFNRNLDNLIRNESKSVVFREYANNFMNAWQYFVFIFSSIMMVFVPLTLYFFFSNNYSMKNLLINLRYFKKNYENY